MTVDDSTIEHSSGFGVAVAQFAASTDKQQNLETVGRLAREAVRRGAALVVFPEFSSYFETTPDPAFVANAEPLDGPFVSFLLDLSAELGAHLVAGLVAATASPGRAANLLVAVSPTEGVVATYSKIHLFDAFGIRESDWLAAGNTSTPQLFDVKGVRVGLQTCYDIRFPEVSRLLINAGADVIAVGAAWMGGPLKEMHLLGLARARAIENTVYVLCADQTPPMGIGSSLVLDPMGVGIAALGEHEGVAVAWVDPARIRDVRKVNPALALRRFDVVARQQI